MKRRYLSALLSWLLIFALVVPMFTGVPIASAAAAAPQQTGSITTLKDLENHWSKSNVQRLLGLRVVDGFSDGTFRPDATVTREQFTKMLMQTLGYKPVKGNKTFVDVPSSRWSYPYIETAVAAKIIMPTEYANKRYEPAKNIPRQEMAIMTARALKLKEEPAALTFTDKQTITKLPGLVGATVKAKIISGYPDKTFKPTKTATRGEASKIIVATLDYEQESFKTIRKESKNEVTYKEKVVSFEGQKEIEISNDKNTITFNNPDDKTKNVKVGQIVVVPGEKKTDDWVARKVVSVSNEGGKVVVKGEAVPLEEVFEKIDVSKRVPVTSGEFIPSPELMKGASVSSIPSKGMTTFAADIQQRQHFYPELERMEFDTEPPISVEQVGDNIKITFKEKEMKFPGNSEATLKLSGDFLIKNPEMVVNADIGLTSQYVYTNFEYEAEGNYTAEIEYSNDVKEKGILRKDAMEAELKLGKIIVPIAGPVTGQVGLKFVITVTGSGKVTIKVENEAQAGFMYSGEVDWFDYMTRFEPNFKFDGNVKISEANATLEIKPGFELTPSIGALGEELFGIENLFAMKGTVELETSPPISCSALSAQLVYEGKFVLYIPVPGIADIEFPFPELEITDKYELNSCNVKKVEVTPNTLELKPGEFKRVTVTATLTDDSVVDVTAFPITQFEVDEKSIQLKDKVKMLNGTIEAEDDVKTKTLGNVKVSIGETEDAVAVSIVPEQPPLTSYEGVWFDSEDGVNGFYVHLDFVSENKANVMTSVIWGGREDNQYASIREEDVIAAEPVSFNDKGVGTYSGEGSWSGEQTTFVITLENNQVKLKELKNEGENIVLFSKGQNEVILKQKKQNTLTKQSGESLMPIVAP